MAEVECPWFSPMFQLRAAVLIFILCFAVTLPSTAKEIAFTSDTGSGFAHGTFGKETSLSTTDTILTLSAGDTSPRLISLAAPHGLVWQNRIPESLPDTVELDGKRVPIQWKLNARLSKLTNQRVSFVYECRAPHLQLVWEWRTRTAFGPIEHFTSIKNLDSRECWLSPQESLHFDWQTPAGTPLEQMYIDKGAGKPSDIGVHHIPLQDGYKWTGTSSTYAADVEEGKAREIIPWVLVQQRDNAKNGWYLGAEFSGRTRISLEREAGSVSGVVGLNPSPGPCRTRLTPGKSFEAPPIFLGASSGGDDAVGNLLHRWIKAALSNPVTWKSPTYPPATNNTWGAGMDINQFTAQHMLKDAASLGMELFHLDAGWFRGVGDWYPDESKFPDGLSALAKAAHKMGLRFGLWVNWTQAGLDTDSGALNVHDPEKRNWLVADVSSDWRIDEFRGRTIDIGFPPAHNWAAHEVERIVRDYHLDLLEHDGYLVPQGCDRTGHPHQSLAAEDKELVAPAKQVPGDGSSKPLYQDCPHPWIDCSNSTDVSYHAVQAYYDIQSTLRRNHPRLLLEVCNDGGRMVDFGTAAHGDYFSITDSYDPISNRRAFYDASYLFPPAMLETYVQSWPTPTLDNFRYMLRSGMMGWFTIMQDTTTWTAEQRLAAREELKLYKEKLRPLLRDSELYHISERPDGVNWDGIEYYDPARACGVVYAFRGSTEKDPRHSFTLRGLSPENKYRVHFTDRASDVTISGAQLLSSGIEVELPSPQSSELVFFEALK